ncbi:NfeD family protein [Ruminiclostridium papyrosolvens]|uniref:Serine protease n=1 Tax=Ruminiclostridium papyrosolvens C7 TaxID=1330534 RepID=U4QZ26_9FIRM|nr:NfeD family protein [Ruminiclostridium papyrosolvens]EPR09250.1 serine protease [Ruminiclostridium papyrosolvens C7]
MYHFYTTVFLVGVFYTIISLIISGISGAFHSNGDFGGSHMHGHGGDSGHMPGHVHADGGGVDGNHSLHGSHSGDGTDMSNSILTWVGLLFNPLVAVSFLTVFGGIGITSTKFLSWNWVVVLIMALGSGIIISTILYNLVAKPLYRSENSSDVSREKLLGVQAEVTTDIMENGFGTIKYTINSIKYTAPARHVENKPVKQGEKVFICKIENNTFYISELSKVLI